MKHFLNLGCGQRFHPDWINVDSSSTGHEVIAHDLTTGLPFADDRFEIVYHSHVLEHFTRQEALVFLRECFRVLKPGGVMRVVVPDLEAIVRLYLEALEKARSGDKDWENHYDWLVLELYDQTIRAQSGGEMATYLEKKVIENRDFVLERVGLEAKFIMDGNNEIPTNPNRALNPVQSSINRLLRVVKHPSLLKEQAIKLLLGQEYNLLELGRFRQGGEIHQWMYDSYSVTKTMRACGLSDIVERSAGQSYINNWTFYNLDAEPDGTVYKPDSLYREGLKS